MGLITGIKLFWGGKVLKNNLISYECMDGLSWTYSSCVSRRFRTSCFGLSKSALHLPKRKSARNKDAFFHFSSYLGTICLPYYNKPFHNKHNNIKMSRCQLFTAYRGFFVAFYGSLAKTSWLLCIFSHLSRAPGCLLYSDLCLCICLILFGCGRLRLSLRCPVLEYTFLLWTCVWPSPAQKSLLRDA